MERMESFSFLLGRDEGVFNLGTPGPSEATDHVNMSEYM